MEENGNKIQYKILIVEDNKIINNLIQKTLNELGYKTQGVFYGKDVIKLKDMKKRTEEVLKVDELVDRLKE